LGWKLLGGDKMNGFQCRYCGRECNDFNCDCDKKQTFHSYWDKQKRENINKMERDKNGRTR